MAGMGAVQHEIIGASRAIRRAIAAARSVAPTTASVLLRGESGTGKELFASLVHRESGRRGPFVAVNCAALPEAIVESVLFGHRRGAFSGATDNSQGLIQSADLGTLFLDEIAELSLPVQAKLLRVLQEGAVLPVGEARERRVDVRIVGASHRDLRERVAAGAFREDLYFRLARFEIGIPALRERERDVVLIAKHFLERSPELGLRPRRLGRNAESELVRYEWPGNVRELQNVLFRAALAAKGHYLRVSDLRAALPLVDRQLNAAAALLDMVDAAGEVAAAEVMQATRTPGTTVKRAIRTLVEAGEIVAAGRGKATRYRRPSATDPRERAALDIAARDGRVTRTTLARHLALPTRTAGRVLERLVAHERLVADGRRGKAAGYIIAEPDRHG